MEKEFDTAHTFSVFKLYISMQTNKKKRVFCELEFNPQGFFNTSVLTLHHFPLLTPSHFLLFTQTFFIQPFFLITPSRFRQHFLLDTSSLSSYHSSTFPSYPLNPVYWTHFSYHSLKVSSKPSSWHFITFILSNHHTTILSSFPCLYNTFFLIIHQGYFNTSFLALHLILLITFSSFHINLIYWTHFCHFINVTSTVPPWHFTTFFLSLHHTFLFSFKSCLFNTYSHHSLKVSSTLSSWHFIVSSYHSITFL